MSIENAILELAAAIRYAADKNTVPVLGNSLGHASAIATLKTDEALLAEMEKAVTKVETDAKAEQKKVMALVEAERKAASAGGAKAAIEQALADAKKAKESETATQNAQSQDAGQDSDDPLGAAVDPLDWDKDVRPALLAVGKDRDALVKLMGKYDVPKGGKAPAEKWADLLAEANAIVVARG